MTCDSGTDCFGTDSCYCKSLLRPTVDTRGQVDSGIRFGRWPHTMKFSKINRPHVPGTEFLVCEPVFSLSPNGDLALKVCRGSRLAQIFRAPAAIAALEVFVVAVSA